MVHLPDGRPFSPVSAMEVLGSVIDSLKASAEQNQVPKDIVDDLELCVEFLDFESRGKEDIAKLVEKTTAAKEIKDMPMFSQLKASNLGRLKGKKLVACSEEKAKDDAMMQFWGTATGEVHKYAKKQDSGFGNL